MNKGITELLRNVQCGEQITIPAQVSEHMVIRTTAARIGGKWKISKNGSVTSVTRVKL